MAALAMLRCLPAVQDTLARTTFSAAAEVDLNDWSELDDATRWCAASWKERRLQYRRSAYPKACSASFEFANERHAVEFKLRFG